MNGNKILDLAAFIGILGALIYICGWSFADKYFNGFEIGMATLNLQKEYILIYGFWVIKKYFIISILLLGTSCIAINYIANTEFDKVYLPKSLLWILGFFVIAFIGHQLGEKHGNEVYKEHLNNNFKIFPKITFEKKIDNNSKIKCETICGRIIIHSGGNIFVIKEGGNSVMNVPFTTIYNIELKNTK